MKNKVYIYIFDYSIGGIYEIETSQSIIKEYNNEYEKFINKEFGLNIFNIHYMVSNKKLEIESLNPINN